MAWWKFGKRQRETVTADWVGEKLAEMFDPTDLLPLVRRWYDISPSDPKPFLTLAALRLLGFYVGATQESVRTRIDGKVMQTIQLSLCGALIMRYVQSQESEAEPDALLTRLLDAQKRITGVFYAKRDPDRTEMHPTYWVAKEACAFLTSGMTPINPEEVMILTRYLHNTIIGTKEVFDDLLKANVAFVQ